VKIKIHKHILIAVLSVVLIFAPAASHLAAEDKQTSQLPKSMDGNAGIKSRDEVIYAVAASDGSVNAVYAVNHFIIDQAGKLTDYGKYTKVTNLTNTEPITYAGDAVSINVSGESFNYQGDMAESALPWVFNISYFLDGEETSPENLSGSNGKLEIQVKTRRNEAVNPVFYENYMLQISITLDTDKCTDIEAPDAILANAGKNKIAAFTVLPGRDADISIRANVEDFSMTGIEISGMPFSMNMEMPETDDMLDDFTQLSDGIAQLSDGVGELKNGILQLKAGAGSLKDGSYDIKTGLSQLSGNSEPLVNASSQIGSALTKISSSLNNSDPSDDMDLSQLSLLPKVLAQLAGGLDEVSEGLISFNSNFTAAHGALAGAIEEIPGTVLSEEQIDTLYTMTDESQYSVLDELVASYTAGLKVKGTYNHVKEAFDAVDITINQVSGTINTISSTLRDISEKAQNALSGMDMMQQLEQLAAGLSQLDKSYGEFHNGLKGYMDGVDQLASGYSGFHSGLSSFGDGIGDLYSGASQLHDGTIKLRDETSDMPDTVQAELDKLMEEYTGSDFESVSFTSPKNEKVDLVQFVIKCEEIEKLEETETRGEEAETSRETLWDRFINLFTGGRKK
jgi:putative membrane protein